MALDDESFGLLQQSVQRFIQERLVPAENILEDEDDVPADIVADMKEMGLFGLSIPEAHGGIGLSMAQECEVVYDLGHTAFAFRSVFGTNVGIGSQGILMDGTDAQKADYLPRIASGEALVVLAQQERKARYRLDVCEAKAVVAPNGYALTAIKNIGSAGDQADAFIVPAQLDGQIALFLVERAAADVSTRGYGTQDGSRAAELALDNAPATLLTTEGLAALELAVDTGIACACAYAVGVMDQTAALTFDYLNQRKQFGVPIASFQALRHRAADMKMQLELARSMSYYASLKLGAPAPERRRALAQAKVQLGQSMRFVGQQSVQMHGGIGVTDEYIGSHYFKTLTQLEMTWGDTLHHLGEVSAQMQDTAGVFG